MSFKGKTCCRYTILPRPSARSLWRMQSAASNLSNFKTPLILQPEPLNTLNVRHLLFKTVLSEVRGPSALKLLTSPLLARQNNVPRIRILIQLCDTLLHFSCTTSLAGWCCIDVSICTPNTKNENPMRLETGWPWGGVLASARRAVDDPLGSRRGAAVGKPLNP